VVSSSNSNVNFSYCKEGIDLRGGAW
jgi:hypothetical protein